MARRTTKVWKVCGCGRVHSKKDWEALKLCGTQRDAAEKRVFVLELRHCHCGSTITITRYEARATSPHHR